MRLYNTSGSEFDRNSLKSPSFKPTATSSDPNADDSDQPKRTMNEQF